MTRESFAEVMKKLLGLYNLAPEKEQAYRESVFEHVAWMREDRFAQVVQELIRTVGRGQRPMPSEYRKTYNTLDAKLNWSKGEKGSSGTCPSCNGTHLVYVLASYQDSLPAPACKPCPVCSTSGPPLEGWREVLGSVHENYMLDTVRSMRPGGARFVLSQVESNLVGYPEEVILALADVAASEVILNEDEIEL